MAKDSKKKRSESAKRYFSSYSGEKQRQKRLKRHMKKHPNDKQAANSNATYRRKSPNTKGGWLTREVANKVYMGYSPNRGEEPIMILNNMTPSERVKMAYFAAKTRAIHNKLRYMKFNTPYFIGD